MVCVVVVVVVVVEHNADALVAAVTGERGANSSCVRMVFSVLPR